jgi:hypothetical protein
MDDDSKEFSLISLMMMMILGSWKTISLDQLLEQQRTLLFRGFLYLKTFLE